MKFVDAFEVLKIKPQIINKKLPIKTSYKFTRLFDQLETETKFFNNTLQSIIEEYGQRDEDGKFVLTDDGTGVKIKEDKLSECMEKIDELNNVEINLTYVPNFALEELDGLELEIRYITYLMPYIKE